VASGLGVIHIIMAVQDFAGRLPTESDKMPRVAKTTMEIETGSTH
jgi:hypothetical protein